MQAFISSAGADLGITGNVRLKSPASNINMLPKSLEFPRKYYNDRSRSSSDCLCAIVHSSQTLSLHCCNTLLIPDDLEIFYVGVSVDCIFSSNFKAE